MGIASEKKFLKGHPDVDKVPDDKDYVTSTKKDNKIGLDVELLSPYQFQMLTISEEILSIMKDLRTHLEDITGGDHGSDN